jgi:NAD(P)-dependent dehydrogenase (short-subunit alcohol dehydrogenase family)
MSFEGKVVVVTGGGMGIGEAIVKAFSQEKAHVVIGDINLEAAQKVIREIGGKGLAVQMDVSAKEEVDRLAEETLRAFGKVDILINSAGILGPCVPVSEYAVEDWWRASTSI